MNFSWTAEQEALAGRLARFAQTELGQQIVERDRACTFDLEGWRRCGAEGVMGMLVPVEFGGQGLDALTAAHALEGLGYGCLDNGLAFAIGAHLWGCVQPILTFGSNEQKQRWLPGLASGATIGALAVSEREAGSDAFQPRTLAERQGDHYILTGHKLFITNGPVADIFLVMASVDSALGSHGRAVFAVERGMEGLTISPPVEKMGLRTAAMGEITLERCAVPAANLLGKERSGLSLFTHAMLWERGMITAPVVGAMQRQLERCVAYARERKQFGQAIGKFQLVSSRLVDMRLRLETARLLQYRIAWMLGQEESAFDMSALTKLGISEAWVESCQDALQIHGGYGYLTETGIERELRDAMAGRLYSGTSEIQRQVIAHWMGVA